MANHTDKCRDRVEKLIKAEDPDRCDKTLERVGRRLIGEENGKQDENKAQTDTRHVCSDCGEKKSYMEIVNVVEGGVKKICMNCVRKDMKTDKPDEKMSSDGGARGSGDWRRGSCEEMSDATEEVCVKCGNNK